MSVKMRMQVRGARVSGGNLKQRHLSPDLGGKRCRGRRKGTLAAWSQSSLERHLQNPARRRRKRGSRAERVGFQGTGRPWRAGLLVWEGGRAGEDESAGEEAKPRLGFPGGMTEQRESRPGGNGCWGGVNIVSAIAEGVSGGGA